MKSNCSSTHEPESSMDCEKSIHTDESNFMRDMRRSKRMALRVAVRISVPELPQKTFDAWTVVVNMHGAMFESTQPFIAGQEIGIRTFSRKFARAKVVWGQTSPNSQGNYGFGVELENPAILPELFDL
jgi:hypothetical protein